jgi:hypothetical protein
MRLMREPIDGPVLAVIAVDSVGEAILAANASDYGLGASVWTADRYQGLRIARELHAGMVWLNDHLPAPTVSRGPWGAAAGSGLGRTLGQAGLRACAQEKLITWDPPATRGPMTPAASRRCVPSRSCVRGASPTTTAPGARAPWRWHASARAPSGAGFPGEPNNSTLQHLSHGRYARLTPIDVARTRHQASVLASCRKSVAFGS